MYTESFRTALRRFTHNVPFGAYVIELTNGQRFLPEHPEAVRLGEDGLAVFTETSGAAFFFDAGSVLRLMAVGAITDSSSQVKPDDEPF